MSAIDQQSNGSFLAPAVPNQNTGAIRILLEHTKNENTMRYLGVDNEDALLLAKWTEI